MSILHHSEHKASEDSNQLFYVRSSLETVVCDMAWFRSASAKKAD
jgi:hypothetical protein